METSKFLDFETNKVQALTLEQLRNTARENDIYGKPLKGIYHFELLEQLNEIANRYNLNAEIWDCFAAQNKDKTACGVVLLPELEEKHGEKAVQAHVLRRIFANIRLRNFDTDELTTNLAVAFHQKGIEVGFGNNVQICHNQTMLCPSQYASTYASERGAKGEKNLTIQEVIAKVDEWLSTAEERITAERNTIKRMKETQVNANTALQLIGMLTAMRVKADTKIKELRETMVYPLSNTQINSFTEKLLLQFKDNNELTAWDIYNAATDLYKPTSMEVNNILPQNRAMCAVLKQFFNIED